MGTRPPASRAVEQQLVRLRSAGAADLMAFFDEVGGAASEKELEAVLGNRYADRTVVARILATPHWLRSYRVKKLLAAHPATPQHEALRLLPHLYWRDLHLVSTNLRVNPLVRRNAERHLLDRLPEMSLGERIALAREAARPVLAALEGDRDLRVIEALLLNPRMTEDDILRAVQVHGGSERLETIARDPRWSLRYAVRVALARHPDTPRAAALGVLSALRREDLAAISSLSEVPTLIRSCALRILEELRRGENGDETR